MTKGSIFKKKENKVKRPHCWVLISHKRGVARMCVVCGETFYYGKHKKIIKAVETGDIMVYVPQAIALPLGAEQH